MADKYEDLLAAGWPIEEGEIRRDVEQLLGGNFREFLQRDALKTYSTMPGARPTRWRKSSSWTKRSKSTALGGGQADAGIGGAVVHPDFVAALDRAAGVNRVRSEALRLERELGGEGPGRGAEDELPRIMEIEQGQPEAIDEQLRDFFHAVIDQQPAVLRFNGRRAETDLEPVPPGTALLRKHDAGETPVNEVGVAEQIPDMFLPAGDRAMKHDPMVIEHRAASTAASLFRGDSTVPRRLTVSKSRVVASATAGP